MFEITVLPLSAFMFDLTYTAVILQKMLLVTEKYILKNRSEVSHCLKTLRWSELKTLRT